MDVLAAFPEARFAKAETSDLQAATPASTAGPDRTVHTHAGDPMTQSPRSCPPMIRMMMVLLGVFSLIFGPALPAHAAVPAPLEVASVAASTSDGNVPENTVDGDLATRWSAETVDEQDPAWIRWDLGATTRVGYLGLAWYRGDTRSSSFDLQVSTDGSTWTTVRERASSSGNTFDLEPVTFDGTGPDVGLDARYVRYRGYGNSGGSGWSSVSEVQLYPVNDAAEVGTLADALAQPDPDAVPFTTPGLTEADGSRHRVPSPTKPTGRVVDVTEFGADPAPGSGDDAAPIRAAIEAAEPGDVVSLPPGDYDLLSTVPGDPTTNISLKSGVSVQGAGKDRTRLVSHLEGAELSGKVLRGYAVHDLRIRNLTVTSTFDGPFSEDTNESAVGGPHYGIVIGNLGVRPSHTVVVEGVRVERFQRSGVRVESSHDVVVQNSTFADATSVGGGGAGYAVTIQGIPGADRYAYPDDSRHNVVRNNIIAGPYIRHGVLLQYYTHNNMVEGNRITDTALDAIDMHGEDEYLNEIRWNLVQDSRASAIGLGNTGGTATQHDASGPGNWIHHNVLSGNREGVKVALGTPDTTIEHNIIHGDGAASGSTGIYVLNAPGTVLDRNWVYSRGVDDYWAVRIAEDPGDPRTGAGEGVPVDVQVNRTIALGQLNGIRVDAGQGIVLNRNSLRGVRGEQLRISPEADVIQQ